MENKNEWIEEFPCAITVCNIEGIILSMNHRSAETFQKEGGKNLLGQNVLECHPETTRSKLKKMLTEGSANIYTIEKGGVRKLIYQSPWYENGKYAGFVELSLPLPAEMIHFKRD